MTYGRTFDFLIPSPLFAVRVFDIKRLKFRPSLSLSEVNVQVLDENPLCSVSTLCDTSPILVSKGPSGEFSKVPKMHF